MPPPFILYKTTLTKDCAGRNRLSVEPERHLWQNDSHNAWQVGLDHKVANFSLEVEVGCHNNIFSWKESKIRWYVTEQTLLDWGGFQFSSQSSLTSWHLPNPWNQISWRSEINKKIIKILLCAKKLLVFLEYLLCTLPTTL